VKHTRTCWLWDGNVPLHEWQETEREPLIDMVTWVFEEGTFVPAARITGDGSQSIVTDYLGTPVQMYNAKGEKTWEADLDIYGKVRTFAGRSLSDCPFRYQGQYEDSETGLYYNRFRYYDPNIGSYISQDPIGLAGNNPTLYGYVKDPNTWTDVLGLYTYYQLKDASGNVVYHGITDRPIQERLLEHARDGKTFSQVSYVDNLSSRVDARNLEGSALHLDKGNSAIQNAVRKDGGFYHSYDPDNLASDRTFLSQAEIDAQMRNAITSNVDGKGKIRYH
jgi:RHS repeat-associated protein